MIYKLLILQLLAHLLGDFVFQPHNWTIIKRRKIITWYHLWHTIIIFVFSYTLSFDYAFFKFALLLSGIHFMIDVLKSLLQVKTSIRDSVLFFIDQLLHLITIVGISIIYIGYNELHFEIEFTLKQAAVVTGFILCAKPSNVIIKNIFDYLSISTPATSSTEDENKDLPNAGKLIGIMERFLVLSLIFVSQYSAVGLIIAAKSILRFRDNKKNEYVLVGTMLSFGIATLLGILISMISVK